MRSRYRRFNPSKLQELDSTTAALTLLCVESCCAHLAETSHWFYDCSSCIGIAMLTRSKLQICLVSTSKSLACRARPRFSQTFFPPRVCFEVQILGAPCTLQRDEGPVYVDGTRPSAGQPETSRKQTGIFAKYKDSEACDKQQCMLFAFLIREYECACSRWMSYVLLLAHLAPTDWPGCFV